MGCTPPHGQGELRRPRPDKRRHGGGIGDLLREVLDLTPQMAGAGLDGAGNRRVAAGALHDETAGPPALAEHRRGHAGGPGLAEEAQAEPGGGEEPGIARGAIRPPAGFVGVVDGGLAGLGDEVMWKASTPPRPPMAALDQPPRAQAHLLADAPQETAMAIVPRGRGGAMRWFPQRLLGRTAGARA